MKRLILVGAIVAGLYSVATAPGYVEVPYSLGQVIRESSHIMLLEVEKVDKTKNLIIYKKLTDLKGKHPTDKVKHNIGKGGFHPREWQNIMNWAEEGKKAVFFHNGGASETCMGTYWYQAYPQGEWWGMSHAEPFLLRTYCGDAEKLAAAVTAILKGEEVVVPCMVDGNKELLHQRKAKLQLLKASLKRANYDAKRDFVAFGGDGSSVDIPEFKTTVLLPESAEGWRFLPAAQLGNAGDRWKLPDFDDSNWRTGKAPIGYGEAELQNRKGTVIAEQGQAFLFRRTVDVPKDVLEQKGVLIRLAVASDNSADVWLNGQPVSTEGETDHEFSYWNTEVELKPNQLRPGKNVLAVLVRNGQGSSDLYFDLELAAQAPIPKKVVPAVAQKVSQEAVAKLLAREAAAAPGLVIDKGLKTLTIDCAIAPRKLPHLDKVYPVEVVACFPHPKGQKAHETVVVFDKVKPIQVHKALAELGLRSGNPARGEGAQAEGPEVKLFLEFTAANGAKQKLPIEQLLVDTRNGNKPLPPIRWIFTGSTLKQPNPDKDEQVYAADLTGTLISIFPVTDETVFQSHLTLKEEAGMKLEIAPNLLPQAGTPARLIVQVP